MGTMTAPTMGPGFLNVPLDVLVNRDLDKDGRDLLETLHKASAATSTTGSADLLVEPASKKAKLQSEPPVESAVDALLRAGRKKPPWTPIEQAVVAIKHCELGNRWTQIAAYLPLRSENDVKNIWHSTLRCKDTQKRSFLRTYALAVHDHAYDYATRKAMFDIAVRQCGPPPQQAAEMISRVQLLMDHPELQAAVQPPSQPHLQAAEQSQADQLAHLNHLLQQSSGTRDDLHQLSRIAHLQQLQLLQLQQQDSQGTEGAAVEQGEVKGPVSVKLAGDKDGDGRRPRTSRDTYGTRYVDVFGEHRDEAFAPGGRCEDTLASEPSAGSLQKQQLHQLISGQGVVSALRNHLEPADGANRGGYTESGVSALRRYNGASATSTKPAANGPTTGTYNTTAGSAPADSLPATLAQMAAAVANDSPTTNPLAITATIGAGESLPPPSRQPGVPLPALGNLLALLYKYNIEQSQAAAKQLGGAAWAGAGGEEETDGGPSAATTAATDANAPTPATAAASPTADPKDEQRGGTKTTAAATTTAAVGAAPGSTAAGAGGQQSQSLPALRPLALRPLQPKRERDNDVKDDEEEGAAGSGGAGAIDGADESPKRPATARGVGGGSVKRSHAVMSGSTGGPPRESASGGQPPALRTRGSVPYSMQDADADELGAVEALALAARMNTQGGRGSAGAASGRGPVGATPAATAATSPAGSGGNTGNAGGRASNTGVLNSLVSIRNGAGAAPAPAAGAGAPRGSANSGNATAPASASGQPCPVLDLHTRPPSVASPVPPPAAPPTAPQPQPQPPRPSLRPPGDLHAPQPPQPPQPTQRQQRSAAPTLDVISVLNMPGLRRQVLALPAQTLVALLCSPAFGSDSEASVFVLVALWLQANADNVTLEQFRAACGAIRLAALGSFYLSAVLPVLVTDPRAGGKPGTVRPGNRWFEMRQEELAFLTRYVTAGSVERALLADVARNVYDCTSPWYDMSPRSMGIPSEGFCFEWHIPKQGLRDALANGAQPHATFTVSDDLADGDDGSGADGGSGGVAVVPYIICRGLEWHVFVDCQQRPGGAVAAGVFVYCRVPGVLRPPGGGGGVGVVPGAGIRLGVHGWRCNRLEEVFVWTFGDETYFVPDAGMGCPSALPLRKRPSSPPGGGGRGGAAAASASAADENVTPWADYLHDGGLRGTLTFLPP